MSKHSIINCSDLYDNAAARLKKLDSGIDETIQDLAKDVEARGVPKNKVARQVVKELTAREVLSPSRIYKGLGIEYKRKYKRREIEETFPQVKNISTEEYSTNQLAVQVAATRTGQSETLKDMNGVPDIRLVSEERKRFETLRQENESLKEKEKEKEKEKLELIKVIAELRKENTGLISEKGDLDRQLAEKIEPRLLNAKELENISEKAGRDIEKVLQRHNTIVRGAVESGQPVPLGAYIIIKPSMALMPVRITIDFEKREVKYSLWKEKLQIPSPSVSSSSSSDSPRPASDCSNTSTPTVTPRESTRKV